MSFSQEEDGEDEADEAGKEEEGEEVTLDETGARTLDVLYGGKGGGIENASRAICSFAKIKPDDNDATVTSKLQALGSELGARGP